MHSIPLTSANSRCRHISSVSAYSFWWTSLRLLLGALFITGLLLEALVVGVTHAAGGKAYFDVEPTFFPYRQSVPRANFVYDSFPGALIQDSLHVKNSGTARGTVIIYPADVITSSNGDESFPIGPIVPRDVGAWITLNSHQITLNPGQSLDIPFALRIPTHIRPGQHAGGFVAEEPAQLKSSGQGAIRSRVLLQTREAIGMLINLPGVLTTQLDATGVTYDKGSDYQEVLVGLANTGTQFLHPSGNLQVMDMTGRQLQKVPMHMDAFVPQTMINYPVYMHHTALTPGTYKAIVNLTYGKDHQLKYTTNFVVPQPPLAKNPVIARILPDLVSPDGNFFSGLTLWHYVVGISLLFLILSALFFWSQKLYKWKRCRKPVDRNQKTSPAELLEVGSKRARKGDRTLKD